MSDIISNKRQVILYGAFDRYNYGDNLMPILLEKYFNWKHYDKFQDIDFVFSSIKDSDLSKYDCKPTVAMRKLLNTPEKSTVIVVGGEVLGADVGVLYLHVQDSPSALKFLKFIRRVSPKILMLIANKSYDAVWKYPYIPNKNDFKNKVKVVYNTVGAAPDKSQVEIVKQADYISVRDERTYKDVSLICDTHLVPDSVLMMSKLIDLDFLESKIRNEIKSALANKNFISIQACPYKVKFTAQQMADELELIEKKYGVSAVLLPIGYASGHDDADFLEKVQEHSSTELLLLKDLTVWEIMYVIAKSRAFYGTSLHGVITAMSFCIPHFCINDEIMKLVSFLETWSVAPYNSPLHVDQISDTLELVLKGAPKELNDAVSHAQDLIFHSLDDVAAIL